MILSQKYTATCKLNFKDTFPLQEVTFFGNSHRPEDFDFLGIQTHSKKSGILGNHPQEKILKFFPEEQCLSKRPVNKSVVSSNTDTQQICSFNSGTKILF